MTNIKQRARDLLTCDELRGRVPEEVRALLRDIVALEVQERQYFSVTGRWTTTENFELWKARGNVKTRELYDLGAPNDPA